MQLVAIGRFITYALTSGVLVMSIVLFVITRQNAARVGIDAVILIGVGIMVGIGCLIASFVVPGTLRTAAIERYRTALGDSNSLAKIGSTIAVDQPLECEPLRLAQAYTNSTLVGQAILEGGSMTNLLLMLVDGSVVVHLTIAGVMMSVLWSRKPSIDRWIAWTLEN
jgi:uncharacterized membrane protein (DUF485 family)